MPKIIWQPEDVFTMITGKYGYVLDDKTVILIRKDKEAFKTETKLLSNINAQDVFQLNHGVPYEVKLIGMGAKAAITVPD